jgi:hypothetical protein
VPGCASRTADRKVIAQGEGEGTTGCATRLPRRAAEDTGCYAGSGVGWEEESGKARTPWAHPSQEDCRWVLDRCSCRCFPSWSNRSSGPAVMRHLSVSKRYHFCVLSTRGAHLRCCCAHACHRTC